MRGGTAISIDDDLATGQTGIPVRAADNECAGRIDVKRLIGTHPAFRQNIFNKRAHQIANIVLAQAFIMLG